MHACMHDGDERERRERDVGGLSLIERGRKSERNLVCISLQDEVKEDLAVEVPPYDDDIYEDVEVGGSGADDDDTSDVYAAVSTEYKAKKRYRHMYTLIFP